VRTIAALVIGCLAGWATLKALLTGTNDSSGLEFERADQPVEFWAVTLLGGSIAAIAFGVALT
jgi:hypothetical protein